MAKVVLLQLLVDLDDESAIADYLNEMLRPAQRSFQDRGCESQSAIIDYRLADGNGEMYIANVPQDVEDAICNETYLEGDAFGGEDRCFVLANEKTYGLGAESLWINAHPHGRTRDGVALYIRRDVSGVCVDAFDIGREMESPRDTLRVEFDVEEVNG